MLITLRVKKNIVFSTNRMRLKLCVLNIVFLEIDVLFKNLSLLQSQLRLKDFEIFVCRLI